MQPSIVPVPWRSASSILGHEARGFSVWLANNLDLLGEALGLDGIRLVERESSVGSYRVDILAAADDDTDDGMPVAIENQYGSTDHDHLGKLVTYLAGQQRGLGVWIAERVTDPHLAAVEFLNRTSDESVGYALLTVRFADAPGGGHYVDFDVLARPNHWTKEATRTGSRTAAPERVEFLTAVHGLIQDRLERAGWYQVTLHLDRPRINLQLPDDHPLKGRGYYTLRAAPTSFRFRHVATGFDTFEESQRFVAGLRARYGESMAAAVPAGTGIEWGITGRGNERNDQWRAVHPSGGYTTVRAEDAADWAVEVASTWLDVLAGH